MDQPVAKISQRDIKKIIERDYPAGNEKEIVEILSQYKSDNEAGKYRVWAALLKISDGKLEILKEKIEIAKTDYRDILADAEYPEYSEKVGFDSEKFSKKELKNIIKSDWNQYQHWLNSSK